MIIARLSGRFKKKSSFSGLSGKVCEKINLYIVKVFTDKCK
jgi:hypothetical protein